MNTSINVFPVNIYNKNDLRKIFTLIKPDENAFPILEPKSNILHFFISDVDFRAANFLKQEMLARNGDVIVNKHVIDAKINSSNVLLMGTPSQLKSLIKKMHAMNIWGISLIREKLSEALDNINIKNFKITSPNNHEILLDEKTKLMAIMNLTPDSFYEQSRVNENEILKRAEKFLSEGAEILDLGAESTRPGAVPVSENDELERLIPALKILRKEFPDAIISVDTYKANVAEISASEGADIINDISGFNFDLKMPEIIADLKIPYVLSHIKGTPKNFASPEPYENILNEIISYFSEKLEILENAGVKRENIILDVGLGFGKSEIDNFALIKNIESFKIFGLPLMIGHSRKRFTEKSLAGTLAVSAMLASRVNLLRVHDIKENALALSIAEGIKNA